MLDVLNWNTDDTARVTVPRTVYPVIFFVVFSGPYVGVSRLDLVLRLVMLRLKGFPHTRV